MSRSRTLVLVCLVILAATLLPAVPGGADPVEVTFTDVTIETSLADDAGDPVALDGHVAMPTSGCPCPGIIFNHGFAGSKNSDTRAQEAFAQRGYVVLAYSSRGFGETPGEVDLMGPKEVQDLIDAVEWLNDPASPVVGGNVVHDMIGQFGASYGGFHAWALAMTNHPAVRTVVPTATSTNLYDSLVPNDVLLMTYVGGFYATGLDTDPETVEDLKPPYSQNLNRWIAQIYAGVNVDEAKAGLEARGVQGRFDRIHMPVYIVQGINDGLFPMDQAVEAYEELSARGVPTKLALGGIGHPPSEDSLFSPEARFITEDILDWYDHWLKEVDNGVLDGPPVSISRASYFDNTWDGTVRYGWSSDFGADEILHLCATGPTGGSLSQTACPDALPIVMGNSVAGSGLLDEPVSHGPATGDAGLPYLAAGDVPTALTFDTEPLGADTDVVGSPSFQLSVASIAQAPAGARGGVAAFQLDPKLWDVAPDGTPTLITRGAFSEPLDATAPGSTPVHDVTFDIFGASYRLAAGPTLRVTLATEDAPYLRPTTHPFAVTIMPGSTVALPTGDALGPDVVAGSVS